MGEAALALSAQRAGAARFHQQHSMSMRHTLVAADTLLVVSAAAAAQRQPALDAAAAQIVRADAEFAKSVAEQSRPVPVVHRRDDHLQRRQPQRAEATSPTRPDGR
jgi:hypothetical protein